jgi:glycosyltransferase involved in cell wall biosynthesis
VTSDVPFVEGGHRVIARSLVRALRDAGHESEMLSTPQNRFGRQLSAYLATWLTDVEVSGDGLPVDRVISLRFPSYAVRHPNHAVWLNHRMREYYDLWEPFRQGLGARGRLVEGCRRWMLHRLDRRVLGRCRHLFAQSATIRDRLERWGNHRAEVLYPPPPQRPYRCDGYDGFVLSVARLQPLKRIDLLIEAAAQVPEARLRIAGEGPDAARLRGRIDALGLAGRVELLGHLTEEELVDVYARSSAVYYGARAEDYGLVTLEAYSSSKPVITCEDSGGPAELVVDGDTGCVVSPDVEGVAGALERLLAPGAAETMGRAAFEVAGRHTWPAVVNRLLEAAGGTE